jgi:hypothetical protein
MPEALAIAVYAGLEFLARTHMNDPTRVFA